MSVLTHRVDKLEYLRSDIITAPHGFSTRYGGVSAGFLESLNLGAHRGDHCKNVLSNYKTFGNAVGFDVRKLVFSNQVHTDIIRTVSSSDCGQGLIVPVPTPCDGLITSTAGVALAVFSADCTPILLHDAATNAVGAIHSGWRGTALGIVKKAVESMTAQFGSDPRNIKAVIGPCIGACCFETHEEVPQAMMDALGDDALCAITQTGEKYHVDLKLINEIWLKKAGVLQVDVSCDCTACTPQRFWSHRRAGNDRGSLASVIVCPSA